MEQIKKKGLKLFLENLFNGENKNVQFYTPDKFLSYLMQSEIRETQNSVVTTNKGYRINVSYDTVTEEEMGRKKATVAQIVLNSLKRLKKKE